MLIPTVHRERHDWNLVIHGRLEHKRVVSVSKNLSCWKEGKVSLILAVVENGKGSRPTEHPQTSAATLDDSDLLQVVNNSRSNAQQWIKYQAHIIIYIHYYLT